MPRRPPTPPLFPYTTLFRSPTCLSGRLIGATRTFFPAGRCTPLPCTLRLVTNAGTRAVIDEGIVLLLLCFGLVGAQLAPSRSEEHTSELQSRPHLVCRLLLE